MVQTADKSGIICDFCNREYRDNFEYFSGELHKVLVNKDLPNEKQVEVNRRFLDIDICIVCQRDIIEKPMVKIIKEREVAARVNKQQEKPKASIDAKTKKKLEKTFGKDNVWT